MRRHIQRAIRNRIDRLPQRRVSLCVRAALLGAVVPMFAAGAAAAATITVNSLIDGANPGDAQCTLREAINNANDDIDSSNGDCAPGSGEDTIIFSVAGTIFVSWELTLSDSDRTTIDGDLGGDGSSDITVSGNHMARDFFVATGAVATLSHLTIADGYAGDFGGGVRNQGDLTLEYCTVTDNYAYSLGGGILVVGGASLLVEHSAIVNNTAGGGAGIESSGTVTVRNSTITGNQALWFTGGGINAQTVGSLTMTHATVSDNSASQGGGLYSRSPVATISHTIISNNAGGNCAGTGTLTNGGGNLRWPVADSSCIGYFGNPMLGPLQDNGGPTFTMLPGVASAAVDVIACTPAVTDDQRGVARPQGVLCDIGAVEASALDFDRIFADGFE